MRSVDFEHDVGCSLGWSWRSFWTLWCSTRARWRSITFPPKSEVWL